MDLAHLKQRYPSWQFTASGHILAPSGRRFVACGTRDEALGCAAKTYQYLSQKNPSGAQKARASLAWCDFVAWMFGVMAKSSDARVRADAGIAAERLFEAVVFKIQWSDVLAAGGN